MTTYKLLTKIQAKVMIKNKKHIAFNEPMNQFWVTDINDKYLYYGNTGFFGFVKSISLTSKGKEKRKKLIYLDSKNIYKI